MSFLYYYFWIDCLQSSQSMHNQNFFKVVVHVIITRILVDRTLNPLGFSPLWFEPRSGQMWESQVLLTDGQAVFSPGSPVFAYL